MIDDFGPVPLAAPASVAALGNVVRSAAAAGQALYPLGGRTMLGLGLPPTRPGQAVDLRGLTQVIDYPARDMTITVQTGITVAALQTLLAAEGQRLPVDVPHAEQATLGGALAVNASGPRRLGHGTLRDYVIGISAVNDAGQEFKAGGRVVKNVAGYDLCKLHIGALGTLGILTQVTLKLRPLPEERALAILACDPEAAGTLLDVLHGSRTRPVCLELLNDVAVRLLNSTSPGLLPAAPCVLVVGFEEKRETVAWQLQQLVREVPAARLRGLEARVGAASAALWQHLVDLPGHAAHLSFKANLLPSAVAAFVARAAALAPGLALQAHAGNGIVIGHAADPCDLAAAQSLRTALQQEAAAAHGNVVVLRCPAAWKPRLPVWGAPRPDRWLMAQVRERFDPQGLFNPGRYLV